MSDRIEIAAKCAIEYWRCAGPRSMERLYSLAEHYAESNNVPLAEVLERAYAMRFSWEKQ